MTGTYSHHINVRVSDEDWNTIVELGQPKANRGKPNVSEALRTLFRHWRQTRRGS